MTNTTQDLQASFATNSMPSMPASEDKDLTDEEQDIIYIRLNPRSWGASKCAFRHVGPAMTVV